MSEGKETVTMPMTIANVGDGLVTLTFGPATPEDLTDALIALGTPEGQESFAEQMAAGLAGSGEDGGDE